MSGSNTLAVIQPDGHIDEPCHFVDQCWFSDGGGSHHHSRDACICQGIRISAQSYLLAFYRALGFVAIGDEYDEDGIPHFEMRRD